jgi:hypothetical protein
MGASACTIIAASATKYMLEQLQQSSSFHFESEILTTLLTDAVIQFNSSHGGMHHLAVDELGHDFFDKVKLVPNGLQQGLLTNDNAFSTLFQDARRNAVNKSAYIGIIITKPPETIAVILPPSGTNRYFLFDSHSRPQLGYENAYLIECDNEIELISCIDRVIIPFPMDDSDGQLNMMYNMFEASIFQFSL